MKKNRFDDGLYRSHLPAMPRGTLQDEVSSMPVHPWQYPTAGFLSREWYAHESAVLHGLYMLLCDKARAAKTEPIRANIRQAQSDVVDCIAALEQLMALLPDGPVQSIALFAMMYASARERAGIRLHSQHLRQHRKQVEGNINRGKKAGRQIRIDARKRQVFFESLVKVEGVDLLSPDWVAKITKAWRRNAEYGTKKLKADLSEIPCRSSLFAMRKRALQK